MAPRAVALPPGSLCKSDYPGRAEHAIAPNDQDLDLLKVRDWLAARPLEEKLTQAVEDAVLYVLDGARTGRFDLKDPDVDSDERRTVGTKLQYRILNVFDLIKGPPLDTHIAKVAVEIKGTVASTWMIPREGQCEICLLIQIDTSQDRHRAFLMRTHRVWLHNGKGNGDQKRGIQADALHRYAYPILGWTALPTNPLKRLTPTERAVVFAPKVGQERRLTALFGFLPETVVAREVLLTVCWGRSDPLRRARAVKDRVLAEHGLKVLVGRWKADQDEAARRGHDIGTSAWVAVRP